MATGFSPGTEAVCHQGGVRLRCWAAQGEPFPGISLGTAKRSTLLPALRGHSGGGARCRLSEGDA